jgi:hypothetical protein
VAGVELAQAPLLGGEVGEQTILHVDEGRPRLPMPVGRVEAGVRQRLARLVAVARLLVAGRAVLVLVLVALLLPAGLIPRCERAGGVGIGMRVGGAAGSFLEGRAVGVVTGDEVPAGPDHHKRIRHNGTCLPACGLDVGPALHVGPALPFRPFSRRQGRTILKVSPAFVRKKLTENFPNVKPMRTKRAYGRS